MDGAPARVVGTGPVGVGRAASVSIGSWTLSNVVVRSEKCTCVTVCSGGVLLMCSVWMCMVMGGCVMFQKGAVRVGGNGGVLCPVDGAGGSMSCSVAVGGGKVYGSVSTIG